MAQFVPKANGIGVRFYVEQNGKKERIYLYEKGWTQEDAEEAMVEYRQKMGFVEDKDITVAGFLDKFYDDYVEHNVERSTAKRYDEFTAIHIVPELGNIKLQKLKPAELQNLYTKMIKKGLSTTTALKVHRFMHLALRYAIMWGYLRYNPCDGVKAPSLAETEKVIPTDEEMKAILAKAEVNMQMYMPVFIASTTGMRLGEILGLHDTTVDIPGKVYSVKFSLNYLDGSFILKQPKTKGSRRPVTFLPGSDVVLKKYLKFRTERQLAAKKYNDKPIHFLVNKNGGPLNPSNVSRWFKKIIRELELSEEISFHSLRHYHASWLLRQNIHPKVVQERLGHSNISITLNTYSHLIPNMQGDVISSLSGDLFNGGHVSGTKTAVFSGTNGHKLVRRRIAGVTK
ncbi:site-specific integrase [Desulfosporosinus fructosivorans]|nr:tyrosine-type recombinase/integrase [Desulfosporosinus fructosivorans]